MRELTLNELDNTLPGEPITLTAVLSIMAVGIIAVIIFKLFMSSKGSTKIPGGWSFDWTS